MKKTKQALPEAKSTIPKTGVVTPRFKLWLELDGRRVFCSGVCQILQEIDQSGSIKEAAAAIGRSYRFVWGRLKDAETALGQPLVETRVGGELAHRSILSPAGRKLVDSYQQLRRKLFEVVDREFAQQFADLQR